MKQRLQSIERILAIQERQRQLAEWKLAALDRERAEIAANEERLFSALNDDERLQGIFVEAMARRLAALAREAERLGREREAQSLRLTEAGLTMKRTERMTERLRREYLEQLGKRGFAELLDVLARREDASFS
jgi:hypothetical protein